MYVNKYLKSCEYRKAARKGVDESYTLVKIIYKLVSL